MTKTITNLIIVVLAVVQATLIFTIALITVPLPEIAQQFSLGATELLLLQVAYGLPFSGLLLFGGRLADRFGGRRLLTIGLLLFAAASLGAALAPGYTALTAMRFAQGVAGALVAPAAIAALRSLVPGEAEFGRAMATWGGVSVLGAIAGFVASGVVTTWLSWRWMFAVPLAVAAVGLVALPRLLPDTAAAHAGAPAPGAGGARRPRLDLGGAVLALLGISLASYGLTASNGHAWGATTVWLPLAIGVALLLCFLLVERRVADPLLPPAFLAQPCRAVGLAGMMAAAAGSLLLEYVLSLYLQDVHGWTGLGVAGGFLPFAVVLLAANVLAARLVGRFGAARTMTGGLLLSGAGMGLLAAIGRETGYLAGILPGSVLLAGGLSLVFSGAAVLSTANVPPHQAGLAGGVMNTAMELGPTVGFALLMTVAATQAEAVRGYAWAFGAAALAYLAIALVVLALGQPRASSHRKVECRRA
ncbi:MFS transporter [Conexibacter woesei]|uniref:Major facilitator superfamily MFS_1 n=1 Tax=Conexibacter woesei (strain DSM 14684 / CCUG 47730 / CIP 108061 / JCM 11494 / NBRC 100937 / ID131577) TaxID=469383 RepID=D3F6M1_CONWI|nr:MFS transporter [Conexibacter woesei]ADB50788.1 major facilitator superfamily MFS_1 [Conexibacter woesei DSM 14684]